MNDYNFIVLAECLKVATMSEDESIWVDWDSLDGETRQQVGEVYSELAVDVLTILWGGGERVPDSVVAATFKRNLERDEVIFEAGDYHVRLD